MSDTFTQLLNHFVFATKNREPVLDDEIRPRVFGCLARIARNRGCDVHAINGWVDHVHLLLRVPPTIAPADLLRDLKANSSRRLREDWGRPSFAWQAGYSAFSVSGRNIDAAIHYIRRQPQHHGGADGDPPRSHVAELEWLKTTLPTPEVE